jgi:hypothetical protein
MLEAINHCILLASKMTHHLTAIHCYHAYLPFSSIKDGQSATNFIRHCFNPYLCQQEDGHWVTEEVPQEVMNTIQEIGTEPTDMVSFNPSNMQQIFKIMLK